MTLIQRLFSPKSLLFIIAILIVIVALLVWLLVQDASKPTTPPAEESTPSVEETSPVPSEEEPEEEEPAEEEETPGTIEGSLSYPSEFIPSQMEICAEDTTTKKKYCTQTHIQNQKYTHGVGYKIEVPAGSYHVFAYFPGGHAGYEAAYRAYYSKFVTCGLSVDCPSHDPIVVTVAVGQTITEIDPQDWYVF